MNQTPQPHKRALRIHIDLTAIQHNLAIARQRAGGQKLFAVVKADAYGHGAVRVAQALDQADGFAVVTLAEAIELRMAGITQPILVLQSAQAKNECGAFHQYQLWPVIHCADQLRWFNESANTEPLNAWLKVDTGMGRLGFQPNEARDVLAQQQSIHWMGIMTHFASADAPQSAQTTQQIMAFSHVAGMHSLQRSLANSAGVLAWPDSQADWARPGIMLYGSNPVDRAHKSAQAPLKAAMRVVAPLISIKRFSAGDTIGYAASYTCPESMSVGYVAVGYGDGLPRVLSPSAGVYLNGHVCAVIGRVSMDSIAIDLRGVVNAQLGDHAQLWGPDHAVEHLADAANTISYELFTSIKGERLYN